MIQSTTWATIFEFSSLCRLIKLRVVTSQIVMMTKICTFLHVCYKKVHSSAQNLSGFYSNGFGYVIRHIFQENYRKMCREYIFSSNGHFTFVLPEKSGQIMGFWSIFIDFTKENVGFQKLLKMLAGHPRSTRIISTAFWCVWEARGWVWRHCTS